MTTAHAQGDTTVHAHNNVYTIIIVPVTCGKIQERMFGEEERDEPYHCQTF